MALAKTTYNTDGITKSFPFTFPYLDPSHVVVIRSATTLTYGVDYTVSGSSVLFPTPPYINQTLVIKRVTPSASKSITFHDASVLTAPDLETSNTQLFYLLQEALDAGAVGDSLPGIVAVCTDKAAQASSSAASAALYGGQLFGYRNKIVNGDCSISRVNGGAATTPAVSSYVIDQVLYACTTGSKLTFQQVVDAPAGLKYSLKVTVATQYAPSAADVFRLVLPVEGEDCIDLMAGTATPASIAVSLYVKGSVPGVYSISLHNTISGASRSYIGTIAVGTTWAKQTSILTLDSSAGAGAYATDSSCGLALGIDLGSGSAYTTNSGSWVGGVAFRTPGSVQLVNQAVSSTLNVTGVQLEKVLPLSSSGTEFENLPPGVKNERALRYLPYVGADGSNFQGMGHCYSATAAGVQLAFKVTPRIPPTGVVISSPAHFAVLSAAGGMVSASAVTAGGATNNVGGISISTLSGLAAGNVTQWAIINPAGFIYFTGAQML